MKFLFNAFGGGEDIKIDRDILIHIIKEFSPEEVYIISENNLNLDQVFPTIKFHSFSYWDLYYCIYENVNWNKLKPLDKLFIKEMAYSQVKAVNIMERDWPYYSPLVKNNPRLKRQNFKLPIYKFLYTFTLNKFHISDLPYIERERIYYRHLRFWNDFFSTNKIDLLLSKEPPHNAHEFIMYEVAKHYQIKTIMTGHTPIITSEVIYSNYEENKLEIQDRFLYLKNNVKINEISFTKDFEEEWKRVTAPPSEQFIPIFDQQNKKKLSSIKRLKITARNWYLRLGRLSNFFSIDFIYYVYKRPFYKFQKNLFLFYEKNTTEPDLLKKYIYFPLHFQPEATSAPLGDIYANQLLIVDMITSFLPDNYYLYVKEHPAQSIKWRHPHFYMDLIANPKVKLMSRKYSSFKLLENCIAVCTITGTAGWEGLFKGKPCLLFGKYIYMFAPGVFRINTAEECGKAIEKIINGFTFSQQDLKYFLKAIEDVSVHTSCYVEIITKTGGNIERSTKLFAEALTKKIKEIIKK